MSQDTPEEVTESDAGGAPKRLSWGTRMAIWLTPKVFRFPRITQSAHEWARAVNDGGFRRLPEEETSKLVAAIWGVKLWRVAIVALIASGVPVYYLRRQTMAVEEQNEYFRAQLEIESEQNYETRKAQLLAIIYDTEQRWPWSKETPKASDRARAGAIASYAQLQLARQEGPGTYSLIDFTYAQVPSMAFAKLDDADVDLRSLQFRSTKLAGVNLSFADLEGARLMDVDLSESDLSHANLVDADLHGANLANVDLSNAILRGARLPKAKMRGAILRRANLRGADLREVDLRATQFIGDVENGADLTGAEYSRGSENLLEDTLWPDGFDPADPRHGLVLQNEWRPR